MNQLQNQLLKLILKDGQAVKNMALNLQIFKIRAFTAIVFAAVMLLGLLWNAWSFIILFTIIHFGCWYEFIKLVKKIRPKDYGYYLSLGILYITFPILMILNMGFEGGVTTNDRKDEILNTILYVKIIPCAIVFSIWINDTMAYIVGSFIGKTTFSKISPKKTWEGTIGGAILCVIVAGTISWVLNYDVRMFTGSAAICAVFGTLGDLLESKLKRMANVKDSGNIMPGHGGFLDRFDSFLVATPFVWLFVHLFMK